MHNYLKVDIEKLENDVHAIGNELTLAHTLVNFLECSLNGDFDLDNADNSNLVILQKRLLKNIINKYDRLENTLNF